ncbi:MAG: ribbon-helix-helix protein, CopG family [Solirubrobacterales bacterium]
MSKLLSVSIPDSLMAETEALARESGRTKSEVVREALHAHVFDARFEALWRYGEAWAEAQGIGPDDVEDLIDAVRAERRAESV